VVALAAAILELAVLGALAAVVAIAFRSAMASVMTVFLVFVGQTIVQDLLPAPSEEPWPLLLPKYSALVFRSGLRGAEVGWPVWAGLGSLVLYIGLLLGLATWLFVRQDLARE
jgi:hypothetical protein